ncbi:hypothetical protein GCU67_04730 [Modestobacter muralis]|uniref:ParB N-terminal domain-containing protein n=1 Tax=Modestobacter muralis TaxID=1608614 RepID=A0A6P0H3G4_9ACTN|nr:hypothetical protein [Modestobacter muralis]NEK93480.1 hypothetical protein [Modestobacter muralis]NEN50247.1 hypothetical protein [Modestobacter muralis]
MSEFEKAQMPPEDLNLDLLNPRMPDKKLAGEPDAIEYLNTYAALDELIKSIGASGWMDYEPLIVLRHDAVLNLDNVVIEGNRRLAALRLLNDGHSAEKLGVSVPVARHPASNPSEVMVWFVESRAEARDYIGFKHINGAFKWDSFAKAKFAAEWLADDPDVSAVSRRLGDSNNTVVRLVNGYRVLHQSEEQGFDRGKVQGRFAFSHLYTGLARPAMRDYLGLPSAASLLPVNPVDSQHSEQLGNVMVWLYGQGNKKPIIKSQNPDLKRFLAVLESPHAIQSLAGTNDLDVAYEEVEDKAERFLNGLWELYSQAKSVSGDIGLYGGDPALVDVAEATLRTVRGIHSAMKAELESVATDRSDA